MAIKREFNRGGREEARLARSRSRRQTTGMSRTLDHLPPGKRLELEFVVELLLTSFDEERSSRWAEAVRNGRVLKIILFGSYARGDWVEDPIGRYFSDYDLLVVVADEQHTDVLEFWETAERRILVALASGEKLRTPVSFIVHSLDDVNEQLARGRYFFMDILEDGVELMSLPDAPPFVLPKAVPAAAAQEEAALFFQAMLEASSAALKGADFFIREGEVKSAAFQLHQAVEALYNGVLLVNTLYTPKSHNLIRLRTLAEQVDPSLSDIWPTDSKAHKRGFELLKQAYVKARYSRRYVVTPKELAWMRERIEHLQARVIAICEARLTGLTKHKTSA